MGHAEAQSMLGHLYMQGKTKGNPLKRKKKAKYWWTEAAAQGYEGAAWALKKYS